MDVEAKELWERILFRDQRDSSGFPVSYLSPSPPPPLSPSLSGFASYLSSGRKSFSSILDERVNFNVLFFGCPSST
jgi:hypothetical protein